MRSNKAETAVHGCHCSGDMAVRMRKVLARPWVGVRVCHLLLLLFLICALQIYSDELRWKWNRNFCRLANVLCHAFCMWHWPICKHLDLSFIWGYHHLDLPCILLAWLEWGLLAYSINPINFFYAHAPQQGFLLCMFSVLATVINRLTNKSQKILSVWSTYFEIINNNI